MNNVVADVEKIGDSSEVKAKGAGGRFKSLIKRISGWLSIDGDIFLESKDWPYLWKK